MRILQFALFVGVLLWESPLFAQDDFSSIKLRYRYKTGEGISGKVFILYKGSDSITSATTNENGEFELELKLEFSTEYGFIEHNSEWYDSVPITFQTSYHPNEYILEFTTRNPHPDSYQGQVAYYRLNNTKDIEEFEVEQILGILKEHPEICIQFSQTIIRSESEKIANKRKANFMKFLKESGVDMSCIQFDEETRVLRAFDEDQRSRIQGAIAAMDSKCN